MNKPLRKKLTLFLIIIGLFIIYILYSLFGTFIISNKQWVENRDSCNYFENLEYPFELATIEITDEKCRKKDDRLEFFFSINIINNAENPITWKLSNLKIDGLKALYYDSPLDTSPSAQLQINDSESFKLYSIIRDVNFDDKIAISDPGIINYVKETPKQ